jgi:hypothetical protein
MNKTKEEHISIKNICKVPKNPFHHIGILKFVVSFLGTSYTQNIVFLDKQLVNWLNKSKARQMHGKKKNNKVQQLETKKCHFNKQPK